MTVASFVFKRFELKYLLSKQQYDAIEGEILERMSVDAYGETTIQSLYYDTDNFRLARDSIEKPVYKEKLRSRCYGLNEGDRDIYLEMKRKYDGVVYKRRIACKEGELPAILDGEITPTQIGNELKYFVSYYGRLNPKIMILYDRVALFEKNSDLRVTFDRRIRYRTDDLNFYTSLDGERLTPEGSVLMEIKTGAAIPLWLCRLLSREEIRKTSFSKYGTAYEREQRRIITDTKRREIQCLNQFSQTEQQQQASSSL